MNMDLRIDRVAAHAVLAARLKALGHPARVEILRVLAERGTCICGEVVEVLPLAQSTVSQHLKVLKEAGFVRGEVEGPKSCYCLDQAVIKQFRIDLDQLFACLSSRVPKRRRKKSND
ncbi:MAG: winged helix-turn-helix transcriptional regulator [Rhizobiales bacterium]|nr:winged helix-turn-helix transcriptional regulator [Hyphomicrobiales bacterium]